MPTSSTLPRIALAACFAAMLVVIVRTGTANVPVARAAQQQRATSYDLIARALAAGQIDEETAYKYRVFAAFADTRLPSAFRGDDSRMSVLPPEVRQVGERLETLSAATRAELAPFFMRPGDAGSWVSLATVPGQEPDDADRRRGSFESSGSALDTAPPAPVMSDDAEDEPNAVDHALRQPAAITWKTVSAVGGKAKVWWQVRYARDSAIAQGLANELTSLIWPRLTGLMNQEPFPDNGIVNNGGDPAFDIYLVRAPAATPWVGMTSSSIAAVGCHPARYILIDTRRFPLGDSRTYGVVQIATHELMHAITFAYRVRGGCPAPWINEASGDWASNWLYPLTDGEHPDVYAFMRTVEYQIDIPAPPDQYDRFYGGHVLPLFLQNATGGTGFMPRMWANFRTMDDLAGVDAVLPGGFEKTWPKFLNQLWNRPPVDAPGFKQWDRFPVGVRPSGGVDNVNVTSQFEARMITFPQQHIGGNALSPGLQPIAGHYRHYRFEPSVRAVTFRNTIREEAITHGTVWAIEMIRGSWKQPIDLTEEWQKFWCRDTAQEDLEELVLIFGNVDWKNLQTVNPREPPTIEAHAIGCSGWTGTTSQTIVFDDPTQGIIVREHVTSTIRFQVDSSLLTPGLPPELWKSVGGVLSWNISVSGKCNGGKSGGTTIVPDSVKHFATMSLLPAPNGKRRHSAAGHWQDADVGYTVQCPEGPVQMVAPSIGTFFTSDEHVDSLATDGKSFTGQYVKRPAAGVTLTTRYSFRCQGC